MGGGQLSIQFFLFYLVGAWELSRLELSKISFHTFLAPRISHDARRTKQKRDYSVYFEFAIVDFLREHVHETGLKQAPWMHACRNFSTRVTS